MVDKNLFPYDLAVVAILKNEAPYLKEWLDYHLLAGVEHFYLYDNDSTDNQAEVAAPYVKAGLVDYFPLPGKAMQYAAYNDAVKRFKFQSRYMAFIDCDEFIYPKTNRRIVEVVDEILTGKENVAALGINWQCFGSNGQDKADYSRGVLERFTRRAPDDWNFFNSDNVRDGNIWLKSVLNPRRIDYFADPHLAHYFDGFNAVNANGMQILKSSSYPIDVAKIVINHYYTKSKEEFANKTMRGYPITLKAPYCHEKFISYDRNEVYDDGILKYRAARAENFSLENDAAKVQRVTKALTETLSRFANDELSDLEAALVCRAASNYLGLKLHEEASLAAILKSLENITVADAQLLIRELPKLLRLPYPAVEDLRGVALQIIKQLKDFMRLNFMWKDYVELDYIRDFLEE